jgi:Predicted transcriptional regulators
LSKYINVEVTINTVFKALNDATRREILELLRKRDMTAGEIADHFSISKPSISHHLELLKQADLVVSVKKGQFVEYSLNTTVIDEMLKWLIQLKDNRK